MSEPVLLATRDLRKRYGKRWVLNGLSLGVRPGEIYGFLGRNGAGKTTTIRIIMGILRGDEGTLEIFGDTVRRATGRPEAPDRIRVPGAALLSLDRPAAGSAASWEASIPAGTKATFERLTEVMDVPGTCVSPPCPMG